MIEDKDLITSDSDDNKLINSSPDALNENLIKPKTTINLTKKRNCLEVALGNIFPCFNKVDTTSKKNIFIKQKRFNVTNWSNKIENNKYNLITFIPVVLFNQFRQFGNLFYLLMSASQFIDELSVGFLFTYISPLAIVVSVSMLKELYDDINRRIQDKKVLQG